MSFSKRLRRGKAEIFGFASLREIKTKSRNVILDENPVERFSQLRQAGVICADFSLTDIFDNDGVRNLHQIPFTFARTRENRSSTYWASVRGLKVACFSGVLSFETALVLTSFPPELKQEALRLIAQIGKHFASQVVR